MVIKEGRRGETRFWRKAHVGQSSGGKEIKIIIFKDTNAEKRQKDRKISLNYKKVS
jgi:hypothetical protein